MAPAVQTKRVREVFINSIRTLTEAVEAKDPYTAGHSRRVTELSVEIAWNMDISRTEVGQVRLAAMLHDVGKIGVREAVLNKEGSLTDEEYDHVMQHMEIGRRILDPILHGSKVLDIVYHHHERFDGKGRPAGLKGHKIPLGARIIGLADAVDAMRSVRPYRPGISPAGIVQEVEKGSGTQFDPAVVDAFFQTHYGSELLEAKKKAAESAKESAKEVIPEADNGPAGEKPYEGADGGKTPQPEEVVVPDEPPREPLYSRKEIAAKILNLEEIKALPFVTAEILNLTSTSCSDINALANTILRDPALVAKIMKLANTSYYATKERVQTLDRALVNIGYAGIREVALGVAVIDLFQSKKGGHGHLDRFSLWRHQIACGVLARSLAAQGQVISPEEAFAAGILHDLGIAVLDDLFGEEYAACTGYAMAKGVPLVEAERAFIGADHTQVADELSQAWHLADNFRLPMEMHHMSWSKLDDLPRQDAHTVMLVKIADTLARSLMVGSDCDPILEDIPRSAFRKLKLDGKKIEKALESFQEDLFDLEAVFLLHADGNENSLLQPEKPQELAGRAALFVGPAEKPLDPVRKLFDTLELNTYAAESIRQGFNIRRPEVVILQGKDAPRIEAALRELSNLSQEGSVGAVKVLILGKPSQNGRLASLYPPSCTGVVEEPFSVPGLQRNLTVLFAN
ncbi:MAG: HDOD domain-containing protein [Planctomycetes bacterium]|nr:HDOD domain-containing protein [Planctomycetota bacterium]